MARNRKRAKERRPRSQPVIGAGRNGDDAADPLAHAAPDVELAEAQLALGRPDLVSETPEEHRLNQAELEAEAEADGEIYDDELEADGDGAGHGGHLEVAGLGSGTGEHGAHLPAARPHIGARLVGFLQGSWHELQRVQWPDRRQVMQATGVVLGFVIVAGIFLGVSDYLAGKLMDYILK